MLQEPTCNDHLDNTYTEQELGDTKTEKEFTIIQLLVTRALKVPGDKNDRVSAIANMQ